MGRTRTPLLAKLARPRLRGAATRERLFKRLDRARAERPTIYVCGPPGSGKTTLVASWLTARRIDGIWYQLDAGDADLPTFFHYLAGAAERIVRKGQPALPALTPDHLHDVPSFSRRFFRALLSQLPRSAAVVLDDYQEIDASSDLHKIVAQAIADVPEGRTLVLISREDAPECYARHITNEKVGLVSADLLSLTLAEARAIANVRAKVSGDVVAQIHARCDGWAAGFTLMLEHGGQGFSPYELDRSSSLRTVFEYFAGQIYDRLTPAQQRILLASSFLPSMAKRAVDLITGEAAAWPFLEDLYRRRWFVEARQARSPEFQFHGLFLAFLRDRARRNLDHRLCQDLHRLAGDALVIQQDLDAAFAAYIAAGAVQHARSLILDHAVRLISHGRWKTAVERIGSLPPDLVSADCWLQYWLGRARMAVSPIEGRRHLETCYQLALSGSDGLCALLSAAGVVESHILAYTDLRPLDDWIDIIVAGLNRDVAFPSTDAEIKVRSALLIALSYRRPDDPGLDACAARVFELLSAVTDVNLRLSATAHLVGWGATTGPIEVAKRAVSVLRTAVGAPGVTAMNAAWGWFLIAWYHCLLREHRESRAAVEMVEELAASENLPTARKFGPIIRTWLEMHANNLPAARAAADRLEALINPAHLYDAASVAGIRAWLAVLHNEPDAAFVHARAAVDAFDRFGSLMHQVNHRLPGIWARILQRDFTDARARVDEMRRLARRTRSHWQEMELRATEAWITLEQQDQAGCHRHLEAMMQLARERHMDHVFARNLHPWMPALCAAALEAGIEVEYVRAQVRRWGWTPPRSRPQQWPWRVRIHTLGTFSVCVDDHPLSFARKMPRKPMAVLKALVAFGPRDVPLQRIVDSLWPDEDGDAAYKAFEAALHRLRHLLRAPDVIEVSDSRISFNERIVWTDKDAFEAAAGDLNDEHAIARALDLYRGPFLPGELDANWSAPCRERLRAGCLRALERVGEQREALDAHQQAIDCYQRGIEIDDMHEPFYQGLMRAYAALHRPVDAIRIYQRLERILARNLGIKPSPSTRRLAQAIQAVVH